MAKRQPKSFEAALEELETIVQQLDRGQTTLEESLGSFERGVGLLRYCRAQLDQAETRIRELVELDEAGNVKLRDFEHEATVRKATSANNASNDGGSPEPAPGDEGESSLF